MDDEQNELYIQLITENERKLAMYVHSLVPRVDHAEDVIQETKILLWKNFDRFQPGTNFIAWARKTAFYLILTHRKKQKSNVVVFSDKFYDIIDEEWIEGEDHREEKSAVLKKCVAKLNDNYREILKLRYEEGLSIEAVAERVGRTVTATYKTLSRIRINLSECAERQLAD